MKTENLVLMQMARKSLTDKWGLAIGTFVVYMLIIGAIQATTEFFPLAGLLSLIISGPMAVGIAVFSINISRNQDARLEQIFQGFNNFNTSLGAYLLMLLFTFLWTLLLIIPGIIFMSNGLFCKYYFLSLLFVYLYFYKTLYEKEK